MGTVSEPGEDAVSEVWRAYRRSANAVEKALIDLQAEHRLSNLEMIRVLHDYQRTLLGGRTQGPACPQSAAQAAAAMKRGPSPSVRS